MRHHTLGPGGLEASVQIPGKSENCSAQAVGQATLSCQSLARTWFETLRTSSFVACISRRWPPAAAAAIGAKTAAAAPLLAAAAATVVNSPSAEASPRSARQAVQVQICLRAVFWVGTADATKVRREA
jgi:hypothetical protein